MTTFSRANSSKGKRRHGGLPFGHTRVHPPGRSSPFNLGPRTGPRSCLDREGAATGDIVPSAHRLVADRGRAPKVPE